MGDPRGEDALTFVLIRDFSPQWNVVLPDDTLLARVTEKFPLGRAFEYVVSVDDQDTLFRDQDEVMGELLRLLPERYR